MRSAPRPRREVSPVLITALAPVLRYSAVRDAYVLRGIGRSRGPVLQARQAGRFMRDADGERD